MIILKLKGGLGNQLFQYAFARHLSLIKNSKLFFDKSSFINYKLHDYALHNFNINIEFFNYEFKDLLEIKEKHFHFDADFNLLPDNIYIDGYWQSEKYFFQIRDVLKNDLQIINKMSKSDLEIKNLIDSSNSVSIHIRRGDYAIGTYQDQVLETLPLEYYYQSIKYLSCTNKNLMLFIFSDDIDWVKDNFKVNCDVTYVDHNSKKNAFQDLRLMSLCKYNIIANSSFSWWAAWLNKNINKIIIAPSVWFSKNAKNLNSKDIIPDKWIKI